MQTQRGVSAFEQIAKLKLVEIPKAAKLKVPMLIIDLDVGFRQNPRKLVGNFLNEGDDIRVQVVNALRRWLEGSTSGGMVVVYCSDRCSLD